VFQPMDTSIDFVENGYIHCDLSDKRIQLMICSQRDNRCDLS
jgi:hypothetical protein